MALRPLARIVKLANLKVTVDKHGNSAYVLIPSLTVEDVDRTGNVNAWRVQKMMMMARMAAYHIPNDETGDTFLEYDKFTSNFFTFLASVETEVSRDFYELPKRDKWPGLGVSFHLGYMGSASLNSVATMKDPDTGKPLAWNTNTVVCVDKSSRKPALIPDWWKEKYAGAVVGNKKLVVDKLTTPEGAHEYQVKVRWSDVDAYKHTNYLSYVKFCLDAAMDAVAESFFTKFENDLYSYHVNKMQLLYISETLAGDIINVSTWENKEDPYKLHFSMCHGNKEVFQSTMKFFEPL